MPKPDVSASAVVVSGGKQYRVSAGDRILVDRLAAEPGASVKLDRVLLFSDGKDVKVGAELSGLDVDAKVIAHRRGPRIESLRYKSKKRVRVHRGGRAHLTALEIVAVGGVGLETETEEEAEPTKAKPRGRAKVAPRQKPLKKEGVAKAEVAVEEPAKKPARRPPTKKESTKKESK